MSDVGRDHKCQKTHIVSSTTAVEVKIGSCQLSDDTTAPTQATSQAKVATQTYLTRGNNITLLVLRRGSSQGSKAEAYVRGEWSHRVCTGLR